MSHERGMPQRRTRSGSRTPLPPPRRTPVLTALEALGFALGRSLRASSAPADTASAAPKPPRRRRAFRGRREEPCRREGGQRTPAEPRPAAKSDHAPKRRRAATLAPEPKVVVAKPPLIRRKAVTPRPAPAASGSAAAPLDASPGPGAARVRGDRVWFRQGAAVAEGEVIRVTLDGSLVVAPLPAGDRLLLPPTALVPAREPQPQP